MPFLNTGLNISTARIEVSCLNILTLTRLKNVCLKRY